MISVSKAIEIALEEAAPLGTEVVSILEADGCVLAEDIFSDIDMPPFEKSSMDGYALRADDVCQAPSELEVVGLIAAGDYPELTVASGQAAKIMTGAPLPAGADSVQMVEKTEEIAKTRVKILESVAPGKHVARKSEVMAANSKVVDSGACFSAALAGVLATVGREHVRVYRRPRVAILITGNELVPADQKPLKGQIRNSNGYALYNQVRAAGGNPELLGIAEDDRDDLRAKIEAGLSYDLLLITGGVSMGDLDFVEEVFEELGLSIFYEKVNIKPGKPTVFATSGKTLVFGLPGNPVSASTVFEIIVRPVLRKLLGFRQLHHLTVDARLSADFQSKTKRENYSPASTKLSGDAFVVTPVRSKGSADVVAFANSNSFLAVPSEVDKIRAGHRIRVVLRDEFWRSEAT